MQATAVTQATTVMSATSNIKDDSNIMTAHNGRKASNNRTANTVWTPTKAGMLAKTVKPATQQHGGRPKNYFAFVPIISRPNQNVLLSFR